MIARADCEHVKLEFHSAVNTWEAATNSLVSYTTNRAVDLIPVGRRVRCDGNRGVGCVS